MLKSPEIQFVITQDDNLTKISELINFYYKNKNKIIVLFNSQKECELLDESLWSYDNISFIPHNIYSSNNMSLSPVLIANKSLIPQITKYNMLINFSDIVLSQYSSIDKIIEIVMPDTEKKAISRSHYKFYKMNGIEVTTHNLEEIIEIKKVEEYEPN
tara:strand:- start:2737 stop:3210 length:474 start_codon:yes stop_codon:yes gene_type:complete